MVTRRLERTMDVLALEVRARDELSFDTLLEGGTGTNRVYDARQRWRARCHGRSFDPAHAAVMRKEVH